MFWTIVSAILFVLFVILILPYLIIGFFLSIRELVNRIKQYYEDKKWQKDYEESEEGAFKSFNEEIEEHKKRIGGLQ